MIFRRIAGLFGTPRQTARSRIVQPDQPAVIYAIGDIHGCLSQLRSLEAAIQEDAASIEGDKLVVYLGDYIDRGPSSAAVIDHLLSPPPEGFSRICLAGNHEEMFLRFIAEDCRNASWLSMGGEETLASYGVYLDSRGRANLAKQIQSSVPEEHLKFMSSLPSAALIGNYCFVHGGLDGSLPLEQQDERVLLWSRPGDVKWPGPALDVTLVHGHSPAEDVEFAEKRINLDIACFRKGVLAAARIDRSGVTILRSN